ncbi:MAG TPA: HlyD family efflux transporter periplasmic adaptor subunit [Luteitalea sp.]|nr:HlyD family efflux transporter periplasmic adaptor subunit [Luteitalea sp.]
MRFALACLLALGAAGCAAGPATPVSASAGEPGAPGEKVPVALKDVTHTLRLHGTVEAQNAVAIVVPRILGQNINALVVTRLVPNGSRVKTGDLVVEFDRQAQLNLALEKKAEYRDLDEQVKRKQAEQSEQRAKDDTALKTAENALALARLEVDKNPLLPKIEAEKNLLLREGAEAEFAQLKKTYALKQTAARAEVRTLEVRRDRAKRAWDHAEANAERLSIRAPLDGLVVLRSIWKGGRMGEPQEGEEVRTGLGLIDVVADGAMRVRVKLNQSDLALMQVGLPADITLDAYPTRKYRGKLERLSPVATPGMSEKVRSVLATFSVEGRDAVLTPDLSAAVDVRLGAWTQALTVPRGAVRWRDGAPGVLVDGQWRAITLGGLTTSDAVITKGVSAGDRVEIAGGSRS